MRFTARKPTFWLSICALSLLAACNEDRVGQVDDGPLLLPDGAFPDATLDGDFPIEPDGGPIGPDGGPIEPDGGPTEPDVIGPPPPPPPDGGPVPDAGVDAVEPGPDVVADVALDTDPPDVVLDVPPDTVLPDVGPDVIADVQPDTVLPDVGPDVIADVQPDTVLPDVGPDVIADVQPDTVLPDVGPDVIADVQPDTVLPDIGPDVIFDVQPDTIVPDIGPDVLVDVRPDTVEPDVGPDVIADVRPDTIVPDIGPDVPPDVCGNGIRDPGEECDDGRGNGDEPDACRLDCTLPFCGDGILDGDEDCDDGNRRNGDGCSDSCLVETPGECYELERLDGPVGPAVVTGTTEGAGDDLAGTCGGTGSPDYAVRYRASRSAFHVFSTNGTSFPNALYVTRGCDGPQLACGNSGAGTAAQVGLPLNVGDTVLVVVDGNRASEGPFTLNVGLQEQGYCQDGVDNDRDGNTDCADTECSLSPFCCPDDVFEPNQGNAASPSTTFATYNANRDATLNVKPGDDDFFNLPICRGAQVVVAANFTHAQGNIDLSMLVNAAGQTIQVAQSNSTTDNEVLTWTVPNIPGIPGNAFLRVRNNTAGTCNSYQLSITIRGC